MTYWRTCGEGSREYISSAGSASGARSRPTATAAMAATRGDRSSRPRITAGTPRGSLNLPSIFITSKRTVSHSDSASAISSGTTSSASRRISSLPARVRTAASMRLNSRM